MAIATGTVTVNAAFLQEIKEVNQELWQLLEELRGRCADPPSSRTQCRRLLENVGQLRDQLALHFALEEAFGYFDDPVQADARLCEQAAELRSEHGDLYVKISDLAENAERLYYAGNLVRLHEQIRQQFQKFDKQLQEHESRERNLILAEYDDDIGVGD